MQRLEVFESIARCSLAQEMLKRENQLEKDYKLFKIIFVDSNQKDCEAFGERRVVYS